MLDGCGGFRRWAVCEYTSMVVSGKQFLILEAKATIHQVRDGSTAIRRSTHISLTVHTTIQSASVKIVVSRSAFWWHHRCCHQLDPGISSN